jgi:hypothetical protein
VPFGKYAPRTETFLVSRVRKEAEPPVRPHSSIGAF